MHTLKDIDIFRKQAFINGQWCDSESGKTITVVNPADGTEIGTVPDLELSQIKTAITSAYDAWLNWRNIAARKRALILKRWYDLIFEHLDDLAAIMTMEQGKPFNEAKGEIAYAASFVEWFAEEAKRVYGDVIPSPIRDNRMVVIKEPVGVCAAITPWNFPSAMITRKVAPALAAGATIIVKPASQTPFSALALVELADRAGIPAGVFSVVTGRSSVIGNELTANPLVRKLSFTGSTETGKLLMKQCSSTVKRISLELGGHAPFIVFADADIEAAVAGAMDSKYRNAGQTCICANRFYVQDEVHDVFVKKIVAAAKQLKVGSGFDKGVQQGPLIDMRAVEKVEAQIEDAVNKGATIHSGGHRHTLGGTFFEPTVIGNVTEDMRIAVEETFGPVAPVFRFKDESDVICMANHTEYGLAAYFYTRDIGRVWRVSEQLEYGMVGINTGMISTESAPFGGMKQSGMGREGSKYGIEEYIEVKYLCMGGIER